MSDALFRFHDVIRLTSPTGVSAATAREFVVAIETVDQEVLHHHLRETPLRYPFGMGDYPNDFAIWAGTQLEDRSLAERLAVLDPFHERDIERLRDLVEEAVEQTLADSFGDRRVRPGQEFFFSRSLAIEIETGFAAANLEELVQGLEKIPATALYHHLYEARLRNVDGRDDLTRWIEEALGLPEVASRLGDLDIYMLSLEDCRRVVLRLLGQGGEEA